MKGFCCKALYVLSHFCLMIEKIAKIVLHEIKDDCDHNKLVFLNIVDFPPPLNLYSHCSSKAWANKTKEIMCTLSEVQGWIVAHFCYRRFFITLYYSVESHVSTMASFCPSRCILSQWGFFGQVPLYFSQFLQISCFWLQLRVIYYNVK